jgi:hypothetical protein
MWSIRKSRNWSCGRNHNADKRGWAPLVGNTSILKSGDIVTGAIQVTYLNSISRIALSANHVKMQA